MGRGGNGEEEAINLLASLASSKVEEKPPSTSAKVSLPVAAPGVKAPRSMLPQTSTMPAYSPQMFWNMPGCGVSPANGFAFQYYPMDYNKAMYEQRQVWGQPAVAPAVSLGMVTGPVTNSFPQQAVAASVPPAAVKPKSIAPAKPSVDKKTIVKKPKARVVKTDSSRACETCGTRSTPKWRKLPNSNKLLCNACGLQYAKAMAREKKAAEAISAKAKTQGEVPGKCASSTPSVESRAQTVTAAN